MANIYNKEGISFNNVIKFGTLQMTWCLKQLS